jgi:HSP20 family molecular chaperone IbpA
MSVIQAIWSPPHPAHPNSPPKPHQILGMHTHHFHFPPTGLLAARDSFAQHVRAAGRKLSHAADGERGLSHHGSVSSWSPRTDIRQTKLAYHIEIEVPGTTDKETLLIQWLSPSTLIVRGEIERPFVGHGKAAEGAYEFERGEESGDGYGTGPPAPQTEHGIRSAQDGTHGHDVSGGGLSLHSTYERENSLKEGEHDGRHVPTGFAEQKPSTYQSSTGSKDLKNMERGKTTDTDGGELKRMITDPGDEGADIPMFLLEERKTGPWQRTFTLPHDIEMKALKARLEGGLLRIDIPTRDVSGEPGLKVEIQ